MKITITCTTQPKRSVLIDSKDLSFDEASGIFSMNRPLGDDWLQKIYSNLGFRAVSVEKSAKEMAVTLETVAQAYEFECWLLHANDEADEGYRTMRG